MARRSAYAFRSAGDVNGIAINPSPGAHEAEFDVWDVEAHAKPAWHKSAWHKRAVQAQGL
ncbi:hypothetical protein [Ensifer canadensis]